MYYAWLLTVAFLGPIQLLFCTFATQKLTVEYCSIIKLTVTQLLGNPFFPFLLTGFVGVLPLKEARSAKACLF